MDFLPPHKIKNFSEKTLRNILHYSQDVICTIDRCGNFEKVSAASKEVWGYLPEELEGYPYISFVVPEDREKTLKTAENILEGEKPTNFENRYLHKKGHYVDVIWSAKWNEEEGLMYCVARDGREKKQAEKALKASEFRLKLMLEEGSDYLIILDREANLTYFSPNFTKGTGYSPGEVMGRSPFSQVHPEDKEHLMKSFEEVLVKEKVVSRPYRYRHNNGEWRWYHTVGTNRLRDGVINGILCNSADITEVIENQKKLLESEARYRMLYESQHNYVLRTNLNGIIAYANKKFMDEFWGRFKNQQCLNSSFFEAIIPENLPLVQKRISECMSYPGKVVKVELEHSGKAEKKLYGSWDLCCVPDHSGTAHEIQYIGVNITENVEYSRELSRQNRLLTELSSITSMFLRSTELEKSISDSLESIGKLLNLQMGCLQIFEDEVDHNSPIPKLNAVWENEKGFRLNSTSGDIICPIAWDQLKSIYRNGEPLLKSIEEMPEGDLRTRLLQKKVSHYIILPLLIQRGTFGFLILYGSPDQSNWKESELSFIKNYGSSLSAALQRKSHRDELEAKVKELAVSNQELEQFAYVASHDLQEPLRMISSFLQRLSKKYGDQLDQKALQYISFAVDGAFRMKEVILDLLELSRVNHHDADTEKVDLNEVVFESKRLNRKLFQLKKAELYTEPLPIIRGHQTLLVQAFQHLISNSLKYCHPHTAPKIRIIARKQGNFWKVSITDNGIGIPSEYFEKIFVIFQRLHPKNEYPGTGVGLSLVKKIIEKQGGEISVNSEEGKGSTFTLSLPAVV
jgi:PAS domain S-box-containing protein